MAKQDGWTKLAVIAGGGALPLRIADACREHRNGVFVIGLTGWAEPEDLAPFDHDWASVGEIGKILKLCAGRGCDAVTFAGIVRRPDFSSLKVDWRGAKLLPKALAAARKGDDALLRIILSVFEDEGFSVIGAHEAAAVLAAPVGPIGALSPNDAHKADMAKAFAVARDLGAHDIGQGCIVCDGLVLAVEAQEGTDAMLARAASLPEEIRGSPDALRGVLAKLAKPIQERRMDLPTVGVSTVLGAKRAGLAGIAVEAGGALIIDRPAVIEAADKHGLFVVGVIQDDIGAPTSIPAASSEAPS